MTLQEARKQVLEEKHGVHRYEDWDDFIDDATLTEILELNDKAWQLFTESQCAPLREEIERLNASKWISVKDRLPERGGEYIVRYTSNQGIATTDIAFYLGNVFYRKVDSILNVTHWQPLPEPHKQ